MKLNEHGEGGTPPEQYGMIIEAGGQTYEIQVDIRDQAIHYYGPENESKIVERFANYKVDGIPGSGITEWQYRNVHDVIY